MISKRFVRSKLREMGYKFRMQCSRVELWKRSDTLHYVHLPRRDLLDESFVRNMLRSCGQEADQNRITNGDWPCNQRLPLPPDVHGGTSF